MKQKLRKLTLETRHILADANLAEVHPSTYEKPPVGARTRLRLMHAVHLALLASGRITAKNRKAKEVQWPIAGKNVNVLGYGAEKVSYRISGLEHGDAVVAVYHLASLGSRSALEVIRGKRENYKLYKKYFGDLVLPTQFAIVDNPWGEGGKPATIQPFVENAEKLGLLSEAQIRERAAGNNEFSENLSLLTEGYKGMLADGICPDFATSNLLVTGSNIAIFDTGLVFSAKNRDRLAQIHPNHDLIQSLSLPA